MECSARRALSGSAPACDHRGRGRWGQRDRHGRGARAAAPRGAPPREGGHRGVRHAPGGGRHVELGRLRHRGRALAPRAAPAPSFRRRRASHGAGLRGCRSRGRRHAEARGDGGCHAFSGAREHGRVTSPDSRHASPRRKVPMSQPAKSSSVVDTYRALHPKSAALAARAQKVIPGGITHDGRHLSPFAVYIDRALGSHKWDVDGHEYVDYWMGHGALFLGHCHPKVVKAIQEQAAKGTHFGASHELEVRWAELITKLVPSAEMVRFAMSGTEATHLALRIARAYTGRNKVVKFQGHFHGWHDGVVAAVNPPYDVPMSAGVPTSVLDQLLVCPPNDIKAVDSMLERGDVAAVILEPAGGQSGTTPTIPGYLQELRTLTTRHKVVLIFDEVITGFRYSPGGAQAYFGVTPDLTTLAKIVSGGLPGGALCGRRPLMSMLTFRGDPDWDRSQRVAHAGTFNANPLSAAAAIATLELVADASLQAKANKYGEELRRELADAMKRAGAPGTCYGEASIFHVSFEGKPGLAGFDRPRKGTVYHLLRCALLNNGVDCSMNHGWISALHSPEDRERTRRGYDAAFRALAAEGAFKGA